MACGWLVFVLVNMAGLLYNCSCMEVTISDTNVTWEQATAYPGCKLAGMDREGLVNINDINLLNKTVSTDVWIGAHVNLSQWINITGCFQQDIVSMSKYFSHNISRESNPVESCFEKCLSNEFALTRTGCYCLNDTYNRGTPCLGHVCGQYNSGLCGNNTCLCRYQPVNPYPYVDNGGNCMALRKSNSDFQFASQDCSSFHSFLCSTLNQTEIKDFYGDNSAGDWNHALFICDHNNQLLLGLNNQSFKQINENVRRNFTNWIGMFRLNRIVWRYSKLNNQQCVALQINATNKALKLRFQNCSSSLPVLCERNNTDTTLYTPPTTSLTKSTSHLQYYSPDTMTSTHTTPNGDDGNPNTSKCTTSNGGDSSDEELESSSEVPLPPIIGSISGVATVVFITSVVCLIKRRRKNPNKIPDQYDMNNVSNSPHNNADFHKNSTHSDRAEPSNVELDDVCNHTSGGSLGTDNSGTTSGDMESQYESIRKEDISESPYDILKT